MLTESEIREKPEKSKFLIYKLRFLKSTNAIFAKKKKRNIL
jgi:hypothetical protein